VHVVVKGSPLPVVLRLADVDQLDTLVAALKFHRAAVWPGAPESEGGG
jgi:hypothetical protein